MMLVCPCLIHRSARLVRAAGRRLVGCVVAAARWWRPPSARVPIIIQCGDPQGHRALISRLRQTLRASERAMGGLPPIPCRVRVLAVAGTPPTFADLGAVLASCTVYADDDHPWAIITLAASAQDQPVSADYLVVTLTAALDHLSAWQPGRPSLWILPARASSARPRLAYGVARRAPTTIGATVAAGLAGLSLAATPPISAGADDPLLAPARLTPLAAELAGPAPTSLPPLPLAPAPDDPPNDPLGLGQG